MFMGNFAAAFITVMSLVTALIIGTYVLAYAAHSLITVVEGTAIGNDRISWPDDPIVDWIARGVFFGALLLIWVAPAAIVSRSLREDWLVDDPGLRFLLLAVPGLWLLFPIGLLSSLSANSKWTIFRSSIVGVLLRVFPSTLMFYILSALVAVATAVFWYVAVCGARFEMLVVAAPLGAAGFLLYARLLGRLSMMIHRLNPTKAERDEKPKKKKKKKRRTPEGKALPKPADPGMGWDPVEETDDDPDDEAEAEPDTRITGASALELPVPFAAADADTSPEASDEFPLQPLERDEEFDKRWTEEVEDEPADPYELSSEAPAPTPEYIHPDDDDFDELGPRVPVAAEQRTGEGVVTHLDKKRERTPPRRRFRAPVPERIGPRYPWWQGVYGFPFYTTSLRAWFWLTVGFGVVGLCCALIVVNYPRG